MKLKLRFPHFRGMFKVIDLFPKPLRPTWRGYETYNHVIKYFRLLIQHAPKRVC